jgi:carboxyl-terminal processing protease
MRVTSRLSSYCKPRPVLLLVMLTLLLAPDAAASADEELPPETPYEIATFLWKKDFRGQKPGPEMAGRFVRTYLERLDPEKKFFLQSDVDEFLGRAEIVLGALIHYGDTFPAQEIYKRYLSRIREVSNLASKLAEVDYDFHLPTKIHRPGSNPGYSRSEAEREDLFERKIKFLLARLHIQGKLPEDAVALIKTSFKQRVTRAENLDGAEIIGQVLDSFAKSLDPHQSYLTTQAYQKLVDFNQGKAGGLGITCHPTGGNCKILQIDPEGEIAAHPRIQPGDVILEIGQEEEGPMEPLFGKTFPEFKQELRGDLGSLVRLRVRHQDGVEANYTVRRTQIDDDSKVFEKIKNWKGPSGNIVRVGIIYFPRFYGKISDVLPSAPSLSADLDPVLRKFEGNVDVIVVDLRKSSGGILAEGISAAGLFNGPGPMAQFSESFREHVVGRHEEAALFSGPTVVVMDRQSASDSELFIEALKDFDRALVIGDSSSFGKGTIQGLLPLLKGALKHTVSGVFSPKGRSVQRKGATPYLVFRNLGDVPNSGEASYPYSLELEDLRSLAEGIHSWNFINPAIVLHLRGEHEKRIRFNPKLGAFVDWVTACIANRQRIETEFDFARLEGAERHEREIMEKQRNLLSTGARRVDTFGDDLYSGEILNITADYFETLKAMGRIR